MPDQFKKNNISAAKWLSIITVFFSLFIFSGFGTISQGRQAVKTERSISADSFLPARYHKRIISFCRETIAVPRLDLKCVLWRYTNLIKTKIEFHTGNYNSFKNGILFSRLLHKVCCNEVYTALLRG